MPIARPVTKTIIATQGWGVPITDAVNEHETEITALQTVPPFVTLTLLNGWVPFNDTYFPLQYRKRGDMVDLRGVVKNSATPPSPGQVQVATLPTEARPTRNILAVAMFGAPDGWGGMGRMDIWSNGAIMIVSSGSMTKPDVLTSINLSYSLTGV